MLDNTFDLKCTASVKMQKLAATKQQWNQKSKVDLKEEYSLTLSSIFGPIYPVYPKIW